MIHLKKNSKIWQTLADSCESPTDFIRAVMALRNETPVSIGEKLGTTAANIQMALVPKHEPGVRLCYNLAMILDIDPYLLHRVCQDSRMKRIIEENQK